MSHVQGQTPDVSVRGGTQMCSPLEPRHTSVTVPGTGRVSAGRVAAGHVIAPDRDRFTDWVDADVLAA